MVKLKRIHEQQNESLEETYATLGEGPGRFWSECAEMMLGFIRYLEENNIATDKWVSTSHQYLVFSQDPITVDTTVTVSAWAGVYKIEYEMPLSEAPWPSARVVGETSDRVEAARMLQRAFDHKFKVTP